MFGMRITVWRNFKLHTSSLARNSLLFYLMNLIQGIEVSSTSSLMEKDWLLTTIGFFLALSVILWIIDIGKNHLQYNVYDEEGICFPFCLYGFFLISFFIHIVNGVFLLKDVQNDSIDSYFIHISRLILITAIFLIVAFIFLSCFALCITLK